MRLLGARDVPPGTPPLIAYRLATCDVINRTALEEVRQRVPTFVETSLFLARLDVANAQKTGGAQARTLLAEAYARFPQSSSVTYLSGNLHQLIGVCTEALRYYDETIALQAAARERAAGPDRLPDVRQPLRRSHRDGHAHDRAAARRTCTRPTTGGPGSATTSRTCRPRRQDIDTAKKLASTGNIHRLAGIIEFDQDELDVSEKDFIAAKSASDGASDCVARWYLGLIADRRTKSTDAAAHFEDAMACYARTADYTEAGLKTMMARTDIDPEFRARQIEGLTAAIKEDRSQQYASACNAANHHARVGNLDKARTLLDVAAKDPALEKTVAELRKIIGGVF